MGALQDERSKLPLEQTSAEQATLKQTTHMADGLIHDAFGTSSEEEGHEEDRVSSSRPTTSSFLFLSCTLFSITRLNFV
jgi:hypothetical protein